MGNFGKYLCLLTIGITLGCTKCSKKDKDEDSDKEETSFMEERARKDQPASPSTIGSERQAPDLKPNTINSPKDSTSSPPTEDHYYPGQQQEYDSQEDSIPQYEPSPQYEPEINDSQFESGGDAIEYQEPIDQGISDEGIEEDGF